MARMHAALAAVAVADSQRGGRCRRELGADRVEPVHRAEHVARLDEEPLAGRSEHDAAARPLEQPHAEVLLELADALRQRRAS